MRCRSRSALLDGMVPRRVTTPLRRASPPGHGGLIAPASPRGRAALQRRGRRPPRMTSLPSSSSPGPFPSRPRPHHGDGGRPGPARPRRPAGLHGPRLEPARPGPELTGRVQSGWHVVRNHDISDGHREPCDRLTPARRAVARPWQAAMARPRRRRHSRRSLRPRRPGPTRRAKQYSQCASPRGGHTLFAHFPLAPKGTAPARARYATRTRAHVGCA